MPLAIKKNSLWGQVTVTESPRNEVASLRLVGSTNLAHFSAGQVTIENKNAAHSTYISAEGRTIATITSKPAPSRRQLLQRRMPSRARISEIIARVPAKDPWLDDRHDW